MLRRRRLDPNYWRWWWRSQVSLDAKVVAAVIAIALLGIGGFVAANGLEGSVGGAATGAAGVEVVTTTVRKVVTVRKAGRVVTAPARVVTRQAGGRAVTSYVTDVQIQSVEQPTETRVVTVRESVPVIRRQQVTVGGGVRTVVRQAPAVTETRTLERIVTEERTVTEERVRTVSEERAVTVVATRTVTETVPVTVVSPVTVTAGPVTVTVTRPRP